MSIRLGVLFAPLMMGAFFLSGCGGGGGGGGSAPPVVTPTPTSPPTTTNASGKLVDDPSGAPLAGIKVGLAPWTPAATPMPEGTTAPDGSFSFTAPNGHYLLVIGSDSTSDTVRPTIHDNVTLTGGTQGLKAPNLPTYPPLVPPAVETSGNYRLATIDVNTEVPCFTNFNTTRISKSLGQVVLDEWLTESSRARVLAAETPGVPNTSGGALTTGVTNITGGSTCAELVGFAFSINAAYSASPNTLWFAGKYDFNPGGHGSAQFPQDPRAFSDPVGPWI